MPTFHRNHAGLIAAVSLLAMIGQTGLRIPVRLASDERRFGYCGRAKGRGNSHMAPPRRNRHKRRRWYGESAARGDALQAPVQPFRLPDELNQ